MNKFHRCFLATCTVLAFNGGLIVGSRFTSKPKETLYSPAIDSAKSKEVAAQFDLLSSFGQLLLREDSPSHGAAMKLLGNRSQSELERISQDRAGVGSRIDQRMMDRSKLIKDELLSRSDVLAREFPQDGLEVEVSTSDLASDSIDLRFSNVSSIPADLEIPFEGAGECADYFEIEAIAKDGSPIRQSFMYAPAIPPYRVKLPPQGMYVHRINLRAYIHFTEKSEFSMLRVKYTNKLSGVTTASEWVSFDKR